MAELGLGVDDVSPVFLVGDRSGLGCYRLSDLEECLDVVMLSLSFILCCCDCCPSIAVLRLLMLLLLMLLPHPHHSTLQSLRHLTHQTAPSASQDPLANHLLALSLSSTESRGFHREVVRGQGARSVEKTGRRR